MFNNLKTSLLNILNSKSLLHCKYDLYILFTYENDMPLLICYCIRSHFTITPDRFSLLTPLTRQPLHGMVCKARYYKTNWAYSYTYYRYSTRNRQTIASVHTICKHQQRRQQPKSASIS